MVMGLFLDYWGSKWSLGVSLPSNTGWGGNLTNQHCCPALQSLASMLSLLPLVQSGYHSFLNKSEAIIALEADWHLGNSLRRTLVGDASIC